MHSAPYTIRVSSPRMALPGTSVDVLGDGDDMRIECGDSLKELLRMRQVALSGYEGDHNLVCAPTTANDGIAKQAQMLVFVKRQEYADVRPRERCR